jgi:hypothetical protein
LEDGGSVDLPVGPDAAKGGLVLRDPASLLRIGRRVMSATLHGYWGFEPFSGPTFDLRNAPSAAWRAAKGSTLVAGRDNGVELNGGVAACIESVMLQRGSGPATPLKWQAKAPDLVHLTLPLAGARPGKLALQIRHFGEDTPASISLTAFDEPSRIDEFSLHAGDATGTLVGNRLDQVGGLSIGGVRFTAGELRRSGKQDQLVLSAADAAVASRMSPGDVHGAAIELRDGRTTELQVKVLPPRPAARLIGKSFEQEGPGAAIALELLNNQVVPQQSHLTFSMRAEPGTHFRTSDVIEVATIDGSVAAQFSSGNGFRLQDANVAVVTLSPAQSLGPSAVGPIQFRIIRGDVRGDWRPLTTLVRLPHIDEVTCASPTSECLIKGRDLFLISRVSEDADLAQGADVPEGYTGSALSFPRRAGGELYLRLRDAADTVARVRRPG